MQPRATHLTVRKNGEFSCFFQVEMNVKNGKPMYIFTCRDVWRLGGWCDKVSGCYWPEMTVKAVFANFTATSADICLLLLRSPSLPRLRHLQRQLAETYFLFLISFTILLIQYFFPGHLSAAPPLSIPPQIEASTRQFEETKILNTKTLRHPERQLAETNT